MNHQPVDSDILLEAAIQLAKKSSWESFSLVELAGVTQSSLCNIRQHFRSKDDIAEALFDRADNAMLASAEKTHLRQMRTKERLVEVIMSWFEVLAPYKTIVKEILAYKLEPGHFHLQAHGITRISRTVQWFLVAAERDHHGLSRIADEVAVTSAYLICFSFFLRDNSNQHTNTRALLNSLIDKIERGHRFFTTPEPSAFSSDSSTKK